MRAVTLANFRPSRRADGEPWTQARIEEAEGLEPEPEGSGSGSGSGSGAGEVWSEVEIIDLDPLDDDPSRPALRSFTVRTGEKWLRIVFLDADENEDDPSPIAATSGPQFRPTVAQVSAILRARTYAAGDEEDPMSVLAGGELAGEFGEDTRPTAEQVEADLIPQACVDVARATGSVPGEFLDDARRVAAVGAAKEIERSYIPEQAEGAQTIYQTLRLTYEADLAALSRNLWFWSLGNRGVL